MSDEQAARYPLAIPITWFALGHALGHEEYKGIVVHPEEGVITTLTAKLVRANFPYPAHWIIDGAPYNGERRRCEIVGVSRATLERLKAEGRLVEGGGCPTVRDDKVAEIDAVAGPLPRWA